MKLRTVAIVLIGWLALVPVFSPVQAASNTLKLKWYSFEEGMELGSSQGKKVFIHFWAQWCTYCHTMEKETFANPNVVDYLNRNFISVKVDTDREKTVSRLFRVNGLPDNWFFSARGQIIGHRPGYIPPDTFLKILEAVSSEQ
jgi:thioredoxin-related protein